MPAIAPILVHSHGLIQFVVDAVEPFQGSFELVAAQAQFATRIKRQLIQTSHDPAQMLVKTNTDNPLIQTIHLAFSQHYPLVITPDCLWLTIAQGFANHVNRHAEHLRQLLLPMKLKSNLTFGLMISVVKQHGPKQSNYGQNSSIKHYPTNLPKPCNAIFQPQPQLAVPPAKLG